MVSTAAGGSTIGAHRGRHTYHLPPPPRLARGGRRQKTGSDTVPHAPNCHTDFPTLGFAGSPTGAMAPRYRIRKKAASAEPATPEHPEPATARPKIITRLVKAQRAVQLINQLKTEDPALCSSPRLKVSYLRARANMKLLKYEQKPELCDRLCFEVFGILDNLLYNEDYLADIKTEAAMIAARAGSCRRES